MQERLWQAQGQAGCPIHYNGTPVWSNFHIDNLCIRAAAELILREGLKGN